jgi:O-antigen/teichoic acid export membrane protein
MTTPRPGGAAADHDDRAPASQPDGAAPRRAQRAPAADRAGPAALHQLLRRPSVRRSGWTVVDQALSSFTTFAVTVAIARSVAPAAFGAFSLGFTVYALVLVVARAVVAQPLAIRFSAHGASRDDIAAASAAAGILGALSGSAMVAAGLLLGGQIGAVVALIGCFMPALLIQDVWRFVFFTVAKPQLAVVNDLVWAVAQLIAITVVLVMGPSVGRLALAWAASAVVAAAVGARQAGVAPGSDGLRYLRRNGDLGGRFAVEVAFDSGSTQLAILVLGGILGPVGVGAIRGSRILLGPFNIVLIGLLAAAIPEGGRLHARRPGGLRPALQLMSAGLVGLAVVTGLVLFGLPDPWGRALLGQTWPATRELLPAAAVLAVGAGVASGAIAGLHVLAAATASMRLGIVTGAVTLVAAIGGGAVAGASGAAWGLCLAVWVNAIGGWWLLVRLPRGSPAARPAGTDGARP